MPIQSHTPVRLGTGVPRNQVGDWAVLIPVVDRTSVWAMVHWWQVDVLPSATVIGSINLELGISLAGSDPNDPGVSQRAWKSQATFQSGSELEFDDSGHTQYVPFNFQRDIQVSVRTARFGSVGHNIEIQLQLFS